MYNLDFYSKMEEHAGNSAKIVLPKLLKILEPLQIQSLADVGCGTGSWLAMATKLGIPKIKGYDFKLPEGIDLLFPVENFIQMDLNNPKNTDLKRFDLAISLETAEHIYPENAQKFVSFLVGLSDIILFSAAIPDQGDLAIGHFNEQWPEYWQNLFQKEGFVFLDVLRFDLINDSNVSWFYKQNLFVIMKQSLYEKQFSALKIFNPEFRLIHKKVYLKGTKYQN